MGGLLKIWGVIAGFIFDNLGVNLGTKMGLKSSWRHLWAPLALQGGPLSAQGCHLVPFGGYFGISVGAFSAQK